MIGLHLIGPHLIGPHLIAMNLHDFVRGALRVATTAGMGKDVVAFLKEKALLTDKITVLEQEKSLLARENATLKKQKEILQHQLGTVGPKQDEFDPDAIKMLKTLFYQGERPIHYLSDLLEIPREMGEYHRDVLVKADMIKHTRSASGDYDLTMKGREYFVDLIKRTDQAD